MTIRPPGWGQHAVGRREAEDGRRATPFRLPPSDFRLAVLGSVLALSAFLQFYRLSDWQFFSDDQAAELNVMHGMLVDHHPPLLGLALSVGHAHIGPLFYYLLAPPLWVGHLDPTAGVAMIGLFQVATVYLIYHLCLLVDAPWAGLCAAGLYATSGLVVYWSRFLWPNVAPFFVVLALYALVALARGRRKAEGGRSAVRSYLVLLACSLAAALAPKAAFAGSRRLLTLLPGFVLLVLLAGHLLAAIAFGLPELIVVAFVSHREILPHKAPLALPAKPEAATHRSDRRMNFATNR